MSISLSSSANHYSNASADLLANHKQNAEPMDQKSANVSSNQPAKGDQENSPSVKKKQQLAFYVINSGSAKNTNVIKPGDLPLSIPHSISPRPEKTDQMDSTALQALKDPIQEMAMTSEVERSDFDAVESSKKLLIRKRRAGVLFVYPTLVYYTTYRIVEIKRGDPEYNNRVDQMTATAINDFKEAAAAKKVSAWLMEYWIEEIKEAYEWEYHVKYQNVSRVPRLQRLLDTFIRGYRAQAAAEKVLPWEIEYAVAEITENFQWWRMGAKEQNIPREPRLHRLLETRIRLFREYATAQKWPSWQIEYEVAAQTEDFQWVKLGVKDQNIPREPRLQRLLETRIRLFREYATAQKWPSWQIEYEVAAQTEEFQWWKLGVKDQNVPREPGLQGLLETRIRLFREYATAQKWLPWAIEYSIAVITEDFQWVKLGVKDQNIPREPRLQKLAELKQRLEREYNERAAQELAKKVNDFIVKATAEKRSKWAIEYEIEAIEEDLEWQYYVQYWNVSRLSRFQELLETKIKLFKEYAIAENWLTWQIEYSVAEITEDFQWVKLGVKDQNIPREPRLRRLLETRIQLFKEYATAEKWLPWEIESSVAEITEDFEWVKLGVKDQNIPREPRLQKILETKIRLFTTYATAEKWPEWKIKYEVESIKEEFEWLRLGHQTEPREQRLQRLLETKIRLFKADAIAKKRPNWMIEADVEVIKEEFEWSDLEQQTEPREQRLQRVLDNKIRLFREHAITQNWLTWQIEYEVAKLTEDFQWWKMGVKDQNIPREPRLQGLLETKIRLFREHAIAQNRLPWEIEYEVAEMTEDFQWWRLGVKDQNLPREPRLQKLLETKLRLFREYAIAEKWLSWEIESAVAELAEDFQWWKLGVKDQNIPREPRLQGLLETRIRLFREYAIAQKGLPWEIESGVAELTEDFQWRKLGVKDQNIPREPRLQKLRELKARLEQEYNEQIAREQIQTQKIKAARETDAKIVHFFSEAATDAVTEYLEAIRKEEGERELSEGFGAGIAGGSIDFDQSLEYNTGAFAGRALYEIAEIIGQSQISSYPLQGPAKQASHSPTDSDSMGIPLTDSQGAGPTVSTGTGAVPIGGDAQANAAAGRTAVKRAGVTETPKVLPIKHDGKPALPKEHPYAIWAAVKGWLQSGESETTAETLSTASADKTTDALAKGSAADRKLALPKEHPYAIWAAAKEWFGSLGLEIDVKAVPAVPADKTTDALAKGSVTDGKPALPKEHPYAIWAAAKEWFGDVGSETAVQAVSSAGATAEAAVVQSAKGLSNTKPITAGSQVTVTAIRNAMETAPLASQQAGGISLPRVQQYVDKLLAGEIAPPIKVDGKIIIDGNHRYIAGRILGREPEVIQWPGGRPETVVPWKDIPVSPEAW